MTWDFSNILLCFELVKFLADLLNVSETSNDAVFDEGTGINSPTNLALEATFVNQNFSQQVLRKGEPHRFDKPNPFVTDEEEGKVASVAYRWGGTLECFGDVQKLLERSAAWLSSSDDLYAGI